MVIGHKDRTAREQVPCLIEVKKLNLSPFITLMKTQVLISMDKDSVMCQQLLQQLLLLH